MLIAPCLFSSRIQAQAYQMGDIALNANYGGPQVTPALIRTSLKLWSKSQWGDNSFSYKISNSGVLNGKLDYGVHEDLSVGFAVSYWDMQADLSHNYTDVDPRDNVSKNFSDNYRFDISALALGVRGNYHFLTEKQMKIWDPYYGLTIGVTRYSYNFKFNSDYPDKIIPDKVWNWRSGWLTYFSTTFGIRIYPIKYVGLNFEAGWDRGAFLFGGLVVKLHTKPPKFLLDNPD